jgi:hypothetical protein
MSMRVLLYTHSIMARIEETVDLYSFQNEKEMKMAIFN